MKRNLGPVLLLALFMTPILALLIATCTSCAIPRQPAVPRALAVRDSFAVKIEVFCVDSDPFVSGELSFNGLSIGAAHGSGVVLGGRRILTALHVVRCPYLADIHVVFNNGNRLRAFVEREWAGRDIARLHVFEDISMTTAPVEKLPLPGRPVCSSFGFPDRGGACGTVNSIREKPICKGDGEAIWCHDADVDIQVIKGNSGGGVYDEHGNLVGIVTGNHEVAGIVMKGFISSLAPIADELYK